MTTKPHNPPAPVTTARPRKSPVTQPPAVAKKK